MPSAAVEAAFRSRLETTITDVLIVGSNGQMTPPDDGREFILIHYPISTGIRPMLTKRRFEEGVARIVYNARTGSELSTPLARADAIAAAFRGDNLKFDGVEVFEPSPPIVNDDNDSGNYFELAVVVPYRYQFDI